MFEQANDVFLLVPDVVSASCTASFDAASENRFAVAGTEDQLVIDLILIPLENR